jgi:CubicO group peptidase (beta-lactamase class C family)
MSTAGLSRTRLDRMHNVMAGYIERGELPGLVSLISYKGETHVDVIGHKAFGGEEPMQRNSIFRISSMTKPITAAATMILLEECRLRLDDPVDQWLPELANRQVLKQLDAPLDETVPANRPLKVRDLLTFTMGFGQIMAAPDAYPILKAANDQQIGMGPPSPATHPAPDEWLHRLGALPLMYQPGDRWMYNTGSDVLGVLISRVTGQPFEAFLRERIFEPLGMKDTGFSVPSTSLDRFTPDYWNNPETGERVLFDDVDNSQWRNPPAFPSGAAGLVSTIDDYFAFSQMMLSFGKYQGQRILARPTVELMTTDQLTSQQKAISGLFPGDFDGIGWGFGVSMVTKRDDIASVPGRYGWEGGLGTSWHSDPKEDMTTILMTPCALSSPTGTNSFHDFWTLAYQAIDD